MRKLLLAALLTASASVGAFAQGTIAFDNQFNTNASPSATSSGYVFSPTTGLPETGKFNLELYGGPSAGTMTLIARLLQSDGSALSGADIGASGQWIDVTGQSYIVPGVPALGVGFFEVQAWEGNFSSYAAAEIGLGIFGNSGIFQNPTGGGSVSAPDLIGMPSFFLCPDCPEPGTLALCGLGAASLLFFRRKKRNTGL